MAAAQGTAGATAPPAVGDARGNSPRRATTSYLPSSESTRLRQDRETIERKRVVSAARRLVEHLAPPSGQRPNRRDIYQSMIYFSRAMDSSVGQKIKPEQPGAIVPVMKLVLDYMSDAALRPAILVLLLSAKSAVMAGWFSMPDARELLKSLNKLMEKFRMSNPQTADPDQPAPPQPAQSERAPSQQAQPQHVPSQPAASQPASTQPVSTQQVPTQPVPQQQLVQQIRPHQLVVPSSCSMAAPEPMRRALGASNLRTAAALKLQREVMHRYFPRLKVIANLAIVEAQKGYQVLICDFYATRQLLPVERLKLLAVRTDCLDTSACLVTPQTASFLVNGKGLIGRTLVSMDKGPQMPTDVTSVVRMGPNLLQVMGDFAAAHLIFVSIAMKRPFLANKYSLPRLRPSATEPGHEMAGVIANEGGTTAGTLSVVSALPPALGAAAEDEEQGQKAQGEGSAHAGTDDEDDEVMEGASRISLNCPLSHLRMITPVKGKNCHHPQLFDFNNYLSINERRPTWRCPCCNVSLTWPDLKVDLKVAKVLDDMAAGGDITDILIYPNGKWELVRGDASSVERPSKRSRLADSSSPGRAAQMPSVIDLSSDEEDGGPHPELARGGGRRGASDSEFTGGGRRSSTGDSVEAGGDQKPTAQQLAGALGNGLQGTTSLDSVPVPAGVQVAVSAQSPGSQAAQERGPVNGQVARAPSGTTMGSVNCPVAGAPPATPVGPVNGQVARAPPATIMGATNGNTAGPLASPAQILESQDSLQQHYRLDRQIQQSSNQIRLLQQQQVLRHQVLQQMQSQHQRVQHQPLGHNMQQQQQLHRQQLLQLQQPSQLHLYSQAHHQHPPGVPPPWQQPQAMHLPSVNGVPLLQQAAVVPGVPPLHAVSSAWVSAQPPVVAAAAQDSAVGPRVQHLGSSAPLTVAPPRPSLIARPSRRQVLGRQRPHPPAASVQSLLPGVRLTALEMANLQERVGGHQSFPPVPPTPQVIASQGEPQDRGGQEVPGVVASHQQPVVPTFATAGPCLIPMAVAASVPADWMTANPLRQDVNDWSGTSQLVVPRQGLQDFLNDAFTESRQGYCRGGDAADPSPGSQTAETFNGSVDLSLGPPGTSGSIESLGWLMD